MPPKRSISKDEPDFRNVSDEQLEQYIECTQQMIFAYYNRCDLEKARVLESVWKDLTVERTCRLSLSAIREVSRREETGEDVRVLKSPKLRRSPVRKVI